MGKSNSQIKESTIAAWRGPVAEFLTAASHIDRMDRKKKKKKREYEGSHLNGPKLLSFQGYTFGVKDGKADDLRLPREGEKGPFIKNGRWATVWDDFTTEIFGMDGIKARTSALDRGKGLFLMAREVAPGVFRLLFGAIGGPDFPSTPQESVFDALEDPKAGEEVTSGLKERVHGIRGRFFRVSGGRYRDMGETRPEDAAELRREARFAIVWENRTARVSGTSRPAAVKAGRIANKGQFIIGTEVAPGIFRGGRTIFESESLLSGSDSTAWYLSRMIAGRDIVEANGPDESRRLAAAIVQASKIFEMSGAHPHPHGQDGLHGHVNTPFGGSHAHTPGRWGGHNHRSTDPIDGQHLNVGDGAHEHLLAKGLTEYIEWNTKVHLEHPWIPNFKQAWIRHLIPEKEPEFRIATAEDWREHTIWNMHSTGIANVEAHLQVFIQDETRLVEKEYEMQDGTRRSVTLQDFEAEEQWFKKNTPPEIQKRLAESGLEIVCRYGAFPKDLPDPDTMCPGECEGTGWVPIPAPTQYQEKYERGDGKDLRIDPNPGDAEPWKSLWEAAEKKKATDDGWHFVECPQCDGTGERIGELLKDQFHPEKQSDVDLGEDWRLLAAKFATMTRGGKTEFESADEVVKFATRALKEILKRGKVTFNPKESKDTSVEMLRRSLRALISEGVVMPESQAKALAAGRATMSLYPRENNRFEKYLIMVGEDGRAYGFVRHKDPKTIDPDKALALEKKTGVGKEEIAQRFPGDTLVAYKVRDLVTLSPPISVRGDVTKDRIIPKVKFIKTAAHRKKEAPNGKTSTEKKIPAKTAS